MLSPIYDNFRSVAHADAPSNIPHDAMFYLKCMAGGMLACGTTHTSMCPVDVVKCNMQAYPEKYSGMGDAYKKIKAADGLKGLTKGWLPTFLGYSMQGCGKFGCYELFKDIYSHLAGPENSYKYRTLLYMASSASAEFLADIFLCPMESIKVRMQTSPPEAKFPTKFGPALSKIGREEGFGSLWKGVAPLWMRQIPYTIVKFTCFESIVEMFYKKVFTKPKDSYSKNFQLGVTFMSGYLAGILCAIVSHPADTVLSMLNKSPGETIGGCVKKMGFKGMWKGLGPRIFMIGTLTGMQWWIYDSWKTLMGFGTTGGAAPVKKD